MSADLIPKLVPILEAYTDADEFRELAEIYSVELECLRYDHFKWLGAVKELVLGLGQGNNRSMLDALLDLASSRNSDGLAHTGWEELVFHQEMEPRIGEARAILDDAAAPSEISLPSGNPFSAKSRVRELLETATEGVFIVDPYIGVGTLDCLRDLDVPVRVLTAAHGSAIESGFETALGAFISEGHEVEIRRATGLHDRHIVFNDRCWMVGGSLKDAGKKQFNCIEVIDKAALLADLKTSWDTGAAYP